MSLSYLRRWVSRPWATFILLLSVLVGPGCGKRIPAKIFTIPNEFRGYLGSPGNTQVCLQADSLSGSSSVCFDLYAYTETVHDDTQRCEDGSHATEDARSSFIFSLDLPGSLHPSNVGAEMAFLARDRQYGSDSVIAGERPVFYLDGLQWALSNGRLTSFRPLSLGDDGVSFEVHAPGPGMPEERLLVVRTFTNPLDRGQPMRSSSLGVREMRLSRRYGIVYLDLQYLDGGGRPHTVLLRRPG